MECINKTRLKTGSGVEFTFNSCIKMNNGQCVKQHTEIVSNYENDNLNIKEECKKQLILFER